MAISETKWFPDPTFLGFENLIEIQLFFNFSIFNSNSNSSLTPFFSHWHFDEKRKIRMSTLAYKRLKPTLD